MENKIWEWAKWQWHLGKNIYLSWIVVNSMSRYDVIIFFYKYINIKYKHEYFIFHILDEKCECYDWSSRQCYPCPWGGWTGAQESFCSNRNKDFSSDPHLSLLWEILFVKSESFKPKLFLLTSKSQGGHFVHVFKLLF